LFGEAIAETVPSEGLVDVHRYLTLVAEGERVSVDATLPGAAWDGRSPMEPACGAGRDFPVAGDADQEMQALEDGHCGGSPRAEFLAACAAASTSPAADV